MGHERSWRELHRVRLVDFLLSLWRPTNEITKYRSGACARMAGRFVRHDTCAIFGSKAQQARTQHQIDIDRLLLSQDVFLKMMLGYYGGFGYAYLLRHFLPRLKPHGVSDAAISVMLIDNPREVFHAA